MSINSLTSNNIATTALDIRPAVERNEVQNTGREKKVESEKEENKSIAPKPSVNAGGQIIGTTISTKA